MVTQAQLREAGLIQVVLQMAREFSPERRLMKSVISAIGALSQDHINRTILVANGACELIVDAVCQHIENPEILDIYVDAVITLAQDDECCARVINKQEQTLSEYDIARIMAKINEINEDYSDTVPVGQVISLVPQTQPLGEDGTVNLLVSKGPNIVTVPNMIGQTVLAGKAALEALGLKVVVNTDQLTTRWGVVTIKRQGATAGTQLRVGDSITISTK